MRIDISYPDPKAIVLPNAIDLEALNGKNPYPLHTNHHKPYFINPVLPNLLTFSILSRRAPSVIN